MFDINPGLMVWTVATFVVLVLVLSKFAWKPLLQSLKDREDKIRQALDMAEKARADAAELLKQKDRKSAV